MLKCGRVDIEGGKPLEEFLSVGHGE
jgi:hypothetical protein